MCASPRRARPAPPARAPSPPDGVALAARIRAALERPAVEAADRADAGRGRRHVGPHDDAMPEPLEPLAHGRRDAALDAELAGCVPERVERPREAPGVDARSL